MKCKNCEKSFEGSYCNHCGQKSEIRRIDAKYLLHEIPNSVFQLDRGFLFTVKELFLRPGHSIRAFLQGKRKPHYKPFAYLIITFTLYALAAYFMARNTYIDDLLFGFKGRMMESGEAVNTPILDWISAHQVYVTLLILPFFSLASYLAFIRSSYNYFEHLVLNLYITGQQMIIYLILGFIFFQDNVLTGVPILIGFFYNFWVYYQFFHHKRPMAKVGLIALTYLTFVIGVLLITVVAGNLAHLLAQ
ncbi:MAG: DUF3667 domain-containing protein [Saprospiraceae bacterium]|nr:DUF3667 domain-containing protein [Saprospiraceae bacterium]